MKGKSICGYHAKWKRVLTGYETAPPTWGLGAPCEVKDHVFKGKSLRRKTKGTCVACESIIDIAARRGTKPAINDDAFKPLQQQRKRAMAVKAEIEERALGKEAYYNSHFDIA